MREVFSSARQFQKGINYAKKTSRLAWTDKDPVTGEKKGFGVWVATIDSNNFDTQISYDGVGQDSPIKAPGPFVKGSKDFTGNCKTTKDGTYPEKKDASDVLQHGLFTDNIE
jgi:hypothetical protein